MSDTSPIPLQQLSDALTRSTSTSVEKHAEIVATITAGMQNTYVAVDPKAKSIAHLSVAMMDLCTAQSSLAKEIQLRTVYRQGDRPTSYNNVLAAIRELELVILRLRTNVPPMEEIQSTQEK